MNEVIYEDDGTGTGHSKYRIEFVIDSLAELSHDDCVDWHKYLLRGCDEGKEVADTVRIVKIG